MSEKSNQTGERPVFPDRVKPSAIDRGDLTISLKATREQCALLAARYGLESVDAFEANLEMMSAGKGQVRVKGKLKAIVRQLCVLSLESFPASIEEQVSVLYIPSDACMGGRANPAGVDGLDLDPSEEETEDFYDDDIIAIGALVEEHFALALDPYPKKPGAILSQQGKDHHGEAAEGSPFSVLQSMKLHGGKE